jgi:hypothetical protein
MKEPEKVRLERVRLSKTTRTKAKPSKKVYTRKPKSAD